MKSFESFESLDEFFDELHQREYQALANLHPRQLDVTWGTYWLRPVPLPGEDYYFGLLVFGYNPTTEELIDMERELGAGEEELEYTMESIREAHDRGYRYGIAYSTVVPTGEWGSTHVSRMWPMTEEHFREAEARNWEVDREWVIGVMRTIFTPDEM